MLDAVYQVVTVRWVYPVESLFVAVLLAFIPYLVFRGAFTRLGRLMGMRPDPSSKLRV